MNPYNTEMTLSVVKVIVSAVLIALISELSKRSTLWGGILASLPLVSLLAMVWLYVDTKNVQSVANLSTSIFWMVIPSLTLFLVFPWLIKKQMPFYGALAISCVATVIAYYGMLALLQRFGIKI